MQLKYPDVIPIVHDDFHTQHIGKTSDGKQFILASPFVPKTDDDPGCEFIALYIFDDKGQFIESKIENIGPRAGLNEAVAKEKYDQLLDSLGHVTFCDIEISPFSIEKYGVEFGLLPTDSEFVEGEEDMSLEFHPGNYMAFYPPWNGEYDT